MQVLVYFQFFHCIFSDDDVIQKMCIFYTIHSKCRRGFNNISQLKKKKEKKSIKHN